MNELYSGLAQVSIQGDRALRFLDFTGNQARYEVIGFESVPVEIADYRIKGIQAIQELLETGDVLAFAPKFNHPASVLFTLGERGGLVIELHDTDASPREILWIAIGLKDSLPVYDYLFEAITPLENEEDFALIAVYRPFLLSESAISINELSSATSAESSVLTTWPG